MDNQLLSWDKYYLRAEHIEALLHAIGGDKIRNKGVRIISSCPLAAKRHASGRDAHPSFAVSIADNDESRCRCLSAGCQFRGTLTELLWAYKNDSGADVRKLQDLVSKHDQLNVESFFERLDKNLGFMSSKEKGDGKHTGPAAVEGGLEIGGLIQIADMTPWLEKVSFYPQEMHRMLNETALNYLRGPTRKVSDEAIEKWYLGWHSGARRISVPQYDHHRRLVNIGGRLVESEDDDPFFNPPPWMHAKGFKKELYLFGEDKFTSYDGKGTIVLVEGMFDVIGLDSKGIRNVGGMLGAYISKTQYTKIITWFNRLIIVPDGDPPGYEAADRIAAMVGGKIEVKIFPTPEGIDPDQLSDEHIDELVRNYGVDNCGR